VLKVSLPHPGNVLEPVALATWAGRGAVRLLERDDERFAMRLERPGPTALSDTSDPYHAVEVAGRLTNLMAIPAPHRRWLAIDPKGRAGMPARQELTGMVRPLLERFADAAELDRERVLRLVQASAVKDALRPYEFDEPGYATEIFAPVASALT
jgi:streptomycin 6-kinase